MGRKRNPEKEHAPIEVNPVTNLEQGLSAPGILRFFVLAVPLLGKKMGG
jgi:hypothetical protein